MGVQQSSCEGIVEFGQRCGISIVGGAGDAAGGGVDGGGGCGVCIHFLICGGGRLDLGGR